jgi:hypothetical protein
MCLQIARLYADKSQRQKPFFMYLNVPHLFFIFYHQMATCDMINNR